MEDRRTHAVTRSHGTLVALCGLGAIVRQLPIDYRPGHPLNCPQCEERAR